MKRLILTAALWVMTLGPAAAQFVAVPASLLYQGLLASKPAPLPPDFSGVAISPIELDSGEKTAGMVGAALVMLMGGDPKAQFSYYVFASSGDAITYNNRNLVLSSRGGKFLAYPPFAQCADSSGNGYCDMELQGSNVVLTASAARVDGTSGAASLMRLGYDNLNSVLHAYARQMPAPMATPAGIDACALVTADDVQTALNQRITTPQRDRSGSCTWRGAGFDALTIQAIETGQAGFTNAKTRTANTVAIYGVGDDAFAFVSQAGFVQLNLVKSNHYVVITLQSSRNALDAAKAVAAKVASRL